MTKIYIYCLFERDGALQGVYSSLKAAHRDALKLANVGGRGVYINHDDKMVAPNLRLMRKIFAGEFDVKVSYFSENSVVNVLKTKLKE